MQVERPQLTKEELAKNTQRAQARAYYHNHKQEVLQKKKEWYANKNGTKFLNHLQPIRLDGISKRESNLRIKLAYHAKKLILKVKDKEYTPEEFYHCFTFRFFAIVNGSRNYEYIEDTLIITVDEHIIMENENCMII